MVSQLNGIMNDNDVEHHQRKPTQGLSTLPFLQYRAWLGKYMAISHDGFIWIPEIQGTLGDCLPASYPPIVAKLKLHSKQKTRVS